jgi:hypothetical protein
MRNELMLAIIERTQDALSGSNIDYGATMRANPKETTDLSLAFPVIAFSLANTTESMYVGGASKTVFSVIIKYIHRCNWRDSDKAQEKIYNFVDFIEQTFPHPTHLTITEGEKSYTAKVRMQMEEYYDSPFFTEQIEMSVEVPLNVEIVRTR